jgi:hypothetical protein
MQIDGAMMDRLLANDVLCLCVERHLAAGAKIGDVARAVRASANARGLRMSTITAECFVLTVDEMNTPAR